MTSPPLNVKTVYLSPLTLLNIMEVSKHRADCSLHLYEWVKKLQRQLEFLRISRDQHLGWQTDPETTRNVWILSLIFPKFKHDIAHSIGERQFLGFQTNSTLKIFYNNLISLVCPTLVIACLMFEREEKICLWSFMFHVCEITALVTITFYLNGLHISQ